MAGLIDRQAAIDALWKALYEYEDVTEKQFIDSDELDVGDWFQHRIFVQNMSDIDRQTILALPSADVVEVVRCKDCVHYMPYDWMFSEVWQSKNIEDYPQNEIGCEWIDHYVKPDDYCSYGERKEQ